MIDFKTTTLEDCAKLADNIGNMDKKEIFYATGLEPYQGIVLCYQLSKEDCEVAYNEHNQILSIHGVMDRGTHGAPWMLLSKDAYKKAGIRTGMVETIDWVNIKLQKYGRLKNYISEENTRTIRWLKCLGFDIKEKIENYGFAKKPFYKFERCS